MKMLQNIKWRFFMNSQKDIVALEKKLNELDEALDNISNEAEYNVLYEKRKRIITKLNEAGVIIKDDSELFTPIFDTKQER